MQVHECFFCNEKDCNETKSTMIELMTTMINAMCIGPLEMLLLTFLADIADFNEHGCYSLISIHDIIEQNLIHALLQQHSFFDLPNLLTLVPDLLGRGRICKTIAMFMQRTMSVRSLSGGIGAADTAFRCQEALSVIFPEL
jgi:hypothetical protein